MIALNRVVLPAPFEPSTARRSPAATRRLMSASATSAPNCRPTPSSSRAWLPLEARRAATRLVAMARPSAADHLQPGFSRPTAPSLRNSASGNPSVWFTAGITRTTLL